MPEIDLGVPGEPEPVPERSGTRTWRRPLPRSLVALGSAVLAAAATALYLGGPADQPAPDRPAPQPARLLTPETWLVVEEGGHLPPLELTGGAGTWLARAAGQHPPDAVLVLALDNHGPRLIGLPSGSYRVRASCTARSRPADVDQPLLVMVSVRDPADQTGEPVPIGCDGATQVIQERLRVTGYQGFYGEHYFRFGTSESEPDPFLSIGRTDPLVVLSFTPA
jgi:hypothetical protein